MPTYATLDECKAELLADETVDAAEDTRLRRLLRQASQRLDKLLQSPREQPLFFPTIGTRNFAVAPQRVNSGQNTLYFGDPLLALTSVSAGGSALAVGTQVELYPTDQTPATALRLMTYSTSWYAYQPTSGAPLVATITGVWGWHGLYGSAWLSSDTLAASLNSSATTLTVSDADGEDAYGFAPRFSPGNLIRVDSEYMDVVAVDAGTNTLRVVRGVLGSTAAAHESAAAVSVWQVPDVVRRAVMRQAAFMYARRGAYQTAQVNDFGTISFPADVLSEVRGMLDGYAYGA